MGHLCQQAHLHRFHCHLRHLCLSFDFYLFEIVHNSLSCDAILDDLERVLSAGKPEFQLFVQHLSNLRQLNRAVNMKNLDIGLVKTLISDIEFVFD